MHVVCKTFVAGTSKSPSSVLASSVCGVCRGVGMFSGKVNPVTGKMEWVAQDRDVTSEDSDLSPELARSQYGDMLHDAIRVSS